jgi:hypothetical protein
MKLFLHFTVDYRDMLLPEPEQLFIIFGEDTVKLVVPVNQKLGQLSETDCLAVRVLH